MSIAAHLDKHFIGFESVNPNNRSSLGGKSKGNAVARRARPSGRFARQGSGWWGFLLWALTQVRPETFQAMWEFIRTSELRQRQHDDADPIPGHAFPRGCSSGESRPAGIPWSHYDTAHLTFVPKNFTVEEFARRL
jgi:hypothetical protein